jgi:hypothetical protein
MPALKNRWHATETVVFTFNTNSQLGGSVDRTVDGSWQVRRSDGTAITAGITESEGDPATGVHVVSIDLTASANYAAGYGYAVIFTGATIDGRTVNASVYEFDIYTVNDMVDLSSLSTHDAQDVIDLIDYSELDSYYAAIDVCFDDSGGKDKYSIQWFDNSMPVTSGITSPTLQVVKMGDGADLVASTTPTAVSGAYKHEESSNRMGAGSAYIVIVGATIDGSARTYRHVISRDSSS